MTRLAWRARLIRLLVLPAAVLLGLGLVAPCMTITTSFGRYDGWLRLIAPEIIAEENVTYSLIGGILKLIETGDVAIGLVLIAFSACFPTLKLAVMAYANEVIRRGGTGGLALKLAHHAGKFSMLDVTVLALFILVVKGLPGRSELHLEWGIWAFAASVLMSLIASLLLSSSERSAAARAD